MSEAAQVLRQVRYTNKAFWRNPASAFFTFAFPLMFLVIFTSLLSNGQITIGSQEIDLSTYYVMAEAAFGVISACFTNIAISVTFQRDQGILKRTRGTPLPGWAYLTARVVHAMTIAFVLVAITVAFGVIFYSASVPTGIPLVQFVLTLLVGGLSFAALALALTAAIPNADAAPPIVNAAVLPLLFLSGIFFPIATTRRRGSRPSQHLPGAALLRGDVQCVPRQRHPVRLVGPCRRGGVGNRRPGARVPVLQLGTSEVAASTASRITLLGSGASGLTARSHSSSPRSNRGYARCGSS